MAAKRAKVEDARVGHVSNALCAKLDELCGMRLGPRGPPPDAVGKAVGELREFAARLCARPAACCSRAAPELLDGCQSALIGLTHRVKLLRDVTKSH